MAEREARGREPCLDLALRSPTPPRGRVAARGCDDVFAQRRELLHGRVLLLGEAHLERRIARHRHAHETRDHLREVRRLAAPLALLGCLELAEQRTHRGDRPERLEPPPEASEVLG